jgi:uncharacterized protein YheU (UPF0270 family)
MAGHDNRNEQPIIVPAERLSPQALNGLIEEFATRNGTDYGRREASLAEKCASIRKQLASGRVKIICDPASQTCNIVMTEDVHKPVACRQQKGTP